MELRKACAVFLNGHKKILIKLSLAITSLQDMTKYPYLDGSYFINYEWNSEKSLGHSKMGVLS